MKYPFLLKYFFLGFIGIIFILLHTSVFLQQVYLANGQATPKIYSQQPGGIRRFEYGPAIHTIGSVSGLDTSVDKVRIGVIGVRGVNWGNLNAALKRDDVECVAISDIDDNVITGRWPI
jgi:hypothetical protein